MLLKMTFLTTFISIIKLYNQICRISYFLNLMNKLIIIIFNFMEKREKLGLVPPTLHYCGHNAKKIVPKKSLLQICTLHFLIRSTKSPYWHQLGSAKGNYPNYLQIRNSIPFYPCRFHSVPHRILLNCPEISNPKKCRLCVASITKMLSLALCFKKYNF